MAGAGHHKPIRDINRLIAQYSGAESDWAKMKSRNIKKALLYGKRYTKEIHRYENVNTSQKVDFKVKKQLIGQ